MATVGFGLRARVVNLVLLVMVSGCASVGPGKVLADRVGYSMSINESWKQQILLNIVRVRYVEPLLFLDVGDIVAGYTMETGGNVGFSRSMFDLSSVGDSSKFDLGVSGRFTDRPTITYKPMTGPAFRKAIMSPLPLRNVALAIDSGVSAHFLVHLGVRSMNGLRNSILGPGEHLEADSRFTRAVSVLSRLQLLNALHVRVASPQPGADNRILLGFGNMEPTTETQDLIGEFQGLLGLDPALNEYELTSVGGGGGDRIVLRTFSLMQVMAAVADRVEIPEKDVESQRALPAMRASPGNPVLEAVAVRSGSKPPTGAYAAIQLREHWFWVDDHDLPAKRVFSFLMLALTMMDESGAGMPMQMTIPVQ